MHERTQNQILNEGYDPNKISEISSVLVNKLKEMNLSIAEAKYITNEMDCTLNEMLRRNPNTKIL